MIAAQRGRVDVDAMLAELTPKEFDELQAATCVGLNPESWMQTAIICAAIYNQLETIRALIVTQMAGKVDKPIYKNPLEFLPTNYRTQMGEPEKVQADALTDELRKRYGYDS